MPEEKHMHSCWETARVLDLLKEISFYLCPLRTLKEFTDLMLSKKKRVVTDTTYSGYYYRAKKIKAYLHDSKKERDNQQKEHQGKHHQKRCRIPDRKQHLHRIGAGLFHTIDPVKSLPQRHCDGQR